jgi:hypothetical protein
MADVIARRYTRRDARQMGRRQDGRCEELIEWFMQQPVAAEGG